MSGASQVVVAIVLGIAFLGVVGTLLAVWMTRLFGGSSSLEILRGRYAKGEIDGAQFDEMRKRLRG
jgi:uncharacterized membrane protein